MKMLAGRMVYGALAGTAATGAMSLVMLAASRREHVPDPAPEVITENLVPVDDAPEPVENALSTVTHFAFGAGAGALFGALAPRLPGPPWARGPLFGFAVLLTSYQGWVPAAGILPPLTRQQPARRRELVVSHAVYGAVLGAVCRPLTSPS